MKKIYYNGEKKGLIKNLHKFIFLKKIKTKEKKITKCTQEKDQNHYERGLEALTAVMMIEHSGGG